MLRVFALFLFVYLLFESFSSSRFFLIENFVNSSPEVVLSSYVFGHSFLGDVYFSVKWVSIIYSIFDCKSKGFFPCQVG